jgi:hypothetical protein
MFTHPGQPYEDPVTGGGALVADAFLVYAAPWRHECCRQFALEYLTASPVLRQPFTLHGPDGPPLVGHSPASLRGTRGKDRHRSPWTLPSPPPSNHHHLSPRY